MLQLHKQEKAKESARLDIEQSATINKSRSRSRKSTARSTSSRDKQIIQRWSTFLHALTLIFIFLSFITIAILALNIWSVFPLSISCDYIVYLLCLSFHLSKSVFFCMLIARLQVAFGTSAYGYNHCQIYSLFGFVILYSLLVVCGTPFAIYGKWLTSPHLWCHVHIIEGSDYVSIGVLSWIVMDMLLSLILLFLFQKPIHTLLRNINGNEKLAQLTIKYSILCWMSILSSLISLLMYLWKHITTLLEISIPLTCFLMVLMHIKYEAVFNKLCCACIACCRCMCAKGYNLQRRKPNKWTPSEGVGSSVPKHVPFSASNSQIGSSSNQLSTSHRRNRLTSTTSSAIADHLAVNHAAHRVPDRQSQDMITELAVHYSRPSKDGTSTPTPLDRDELDL